MKFLNTIEDASLLVQDADHRLVSDTEKAVWNGKASTDLATTSTNGLMSSEDKTKLDGLGAGGDYTLPVASPTTLGGVKSGTDIAVDASGNVSINDDSHNHTNLHSHANKTVLDLLGDNAGSLTYNGSAVGTGGSGTVENLTLTTLDLGPYQIAYNATTNKLDFIYNG